MIAPNNRIARPLAPHWSNLLTFTSSVTCACFWLVVVFELRASSHLRQRRFFYLTILFSLSPRMKRHPPLTHRQRCHQLRTIVSDVNGGGGALQQAQASCPIGPRPARRRVPPSNPRPLHFRLVKGHWAVNACRLKQGAPRRIPHLHRLPEHPTAARWAYQQLDRKGPTAGHGLVEGGGEVAVAGVPCQQVHRTASAAAAAGRADPLPPPPPPSVLIPTSALASVPQEMSTRIGDTREATMFFWRGLYVFFWCGVLLTNEKCVWLTYYSISQKLVVWPFFHWIKGWANFELTTQLHKKCVSLRFIQQY